MTKPRIKVKAKSRALLNVVPFVPPGSTVSADVRDAANDLMARIDAGLVQALAIVTVSPSGRQVWRVYAGGWPVTVAGGLAELQMKILSED